MAGSLSVASTAVSFAIFAVVDSGEVGRSAVCSKYNSGPRTLPWGTPALTGDSSVYSVSTFTTYRLELSFKRKTGRCITSRILIAIHSCVEKQISVKHIFKYFVYKDYQFHSNWATHSFLLFKKKTCTHYSETLNKSAKICVPKFYV
jgi:hypothetical protein